MKHKIGKFIALATLFIAGLYSFGVSALAAEEDFDQQEITFTLVQEKTPPGSSTDKPSSGILGSKPFGKEVFPSTGEVIKYTLPIIGVGLIVGYLFFKRRKGVKSSGN